MSAQWLLNTLVLEVLEDLEPLLSAESPPVAVAQLLEHLAKNGAAAGVGPAVVALVDTRRREVYG